MNLKKLKKYFNKNESNISMILGFIVIIIVGFFIIKNYNKEQPGETIPSIGTENDSSNGTVQKYTVQKNDSLWKISVKYYNSGYEWNSIAVANNIKPPYNLEEGQELSIPKVKENNITPQISISPTIKSNVQIDTAEKPISGVSYAVVKGDNLWNIAVRSYGDGYKWVEIAKANDLKNPGIIHPGNVFVIPR